MEREAGLNGLNRGCDPLILQLLVHAELFAEGGWRPVCQIQLHCLNCQNRVSKKNSKSTITLQQLLFSNSFTVKKQLYTVTVLSATPLN